MAPAESDRDRCHQLMLTGRNSHPPLEHIVPKKTHSPGPIVACHLSVRGNSFCSKKTHITGTGYGVHRHPPYTMPGPS